MADKLREEYSDFIFDLLCKEEIDCIHNFINTNDELEQIPILEKNIFKQSFIEGIVKFSNCSFEWVDPNNTDITGKCEILPIEKIINPVFKKEEIEDPDEDMHWLDFRLVDRVQPEWVVGIFCGKNATNSLYFHKWDGIPQYLGLDLNGYIKMLMATRGFNLWQSALIDYKYGEERTDALEVMKEHLPRLFPEIIIDEVFALYESLYISEPMVPGAE